MDNKLMFSKLQFEDVYDENYRNFIQNNELDFENKNTIVIYAPNGTGKTCFTKAINSQIKLASLNTKKAKRRER